MDEETCTNTGMPRYECPCMWCSTPMFFFKYMLVDSKINAIPDVIITLQEKLDFFRNLKEEGFRLMGDIDDHYAAFEPPFSEDVYWVSCRSSGCYLKIPNDELPPKACPECKKNVYEHER